MQANNSRTFFDGKDEITWQQRQKKDQLLKKRGVLTWPLNNESGCGVDSGCRIHAASAYLTGLTSVTVTGASDGTVRSHVKTKNGPDIATHLVMAREYAALTTTAERGLKE